MEKNRQKQYESDFEGDSEETLTLKEVLPQAIDDAMEDDDEEL